MTCEICGNELPAPNKVVGGRPRQYCGADCRKYNEIVYTMEVILMRMNPTPTKARTLRADLWTLANRLNRKGNQCVF